MNKRTLTWACVFGALAVALGAFGAHSLRSVFPPESISIFETGVRYQFYHAFGLFAVAMMSERFPSSKLIAWAGHLFVAGIFMFSGSLYALAAIKAGAISGPGFIGIITPVGGLSFIAGWLLLLAGVRKK
jgi:uncharacterized membrane protein YgdD (TMEM256/DUF423 family)